jgi:hypothetical protein
MQLRVLATSADSSKSWDLRCAIREQFITYIQKNYPQSLPKIRASFECEKIRRIGLHDESKPTAEQALRH